MWGSDVLIANQMESNGQPDHVVVSEATKQILLSEVSPFKEKYAFEFHQEVQKKGEEGTINTYVLSDASM